METIMKMENDNLCVTRFHREVAMEEEKGKLISTQKSHQKREKEGGDSGDWGEREEGEMGVERENGTGDMSVEKINEDLPSIDDVCPICFDRFTVPCRSNCGHWFCASCILQFWMFRSSLQPCKCPLCCCRIVKLEPQISQQADNSVDVLKRVRQYNGLYITGVLGAFHRVQAFPLLMGRVFRVLMDPDSLRCIHYVTRLLGWCLALLYEKGEFEFMPTGGLGIQRMFNLGGSLLIVVLYLTGMVYRWVLRRRARRFGALQVWNT